MKIWFFKIFELQNLICLDFWLSSKHIWTSFQTLIFVDFLVLKFVIVSFFRLKTLFFIFQACRKYFFSVFGLSSFLVSSLKVLQSNLLKIDCLPRIEKTKTKETIIKLKSYSFFRIFRIGILPYVSLHSFLNMFLHLFLFI